MKQYVQYTTPDNALYYGIAEHVLCAPHCLIAGATGSGKSVLLNSIIFSAICESPVDRKFVFIDLKRVELIDYKKLPHTIAYCDDTKSIINALKTIDRVIDDRYRKMQAQGVKKYDGSDIYIVIDEYAELVTDKQRKKQIEPELMRIAQIGRAANIHIILCTQRPTRDVITGQIKVNLDTSIALRTATALDSRNIIGIAGAEKLPRYGKCIFQQYGYTQTVDVPYTSEQDIKERVAHWLSKDNVRYFWA